MKLDLKILTFNIRCFGFDGDYFARSRSESRINSLKEFIHHNFLDTDVFILQEIMDLSILSSILPEGFKFYTYEHEYPRHMHVVLACKSSLEFKNICTIQNTALDTTKSRPVLYGKLFFDTSPIAHVIGVHLKSGFEHTNKRVKQCEAIVEFVSNLDADLPIIMGGDFNSHFKHKTKSNEDDISHFKNVFGNILVLQDHKKKTYVLPTEDAQLDHLWTRGVMTKQVQVYELENYSLANSLKNYYREISDHLPVELFTQLHY